MVAVGDDINVQTQVPMVMVMVREGQPPLARRLPGLCYFSTE